MKIGFIGTGIMGSRMAANLLTKGHEVIVHNRTRNRADSLIRAGAVWASTPGEAAKQVKIVITMLATPDAVAGAALGDTGILQSLIPGSLWIDCSTVNPSFSRSMAEAASAGRGRFVDAPVAGSRGPAEQAQLIFYCGGEKADVDEARPVLEAMGKAVLHIGPAGMGASMKMVNNLMVAQAMAAFSEALVLGESLGISKETLFNTLQNSPVTAPILMLKRKKFETGDFEAEFPLQWMHKDMQLILQTAYETGAAVPAAGATKEVYALAVRKGMGELDFSAVYRLLAERK